MEWFNYNTRARFSSNDAIANIMFSHLGKWFKIRIKPNDNHLAKYCQVAANTFRFISSGGNRVTDDNLEIKNVIPIIKRKKK